MREMRKHANAEARATASDDVETSHLPAQKEQNTPVGLRYESTTAMIQCVCGDVFFESGSVVAVDRKQQRWHEKHQRCTKKPRAPRKMFWMSFCDGERPKGRQFLGACLIEVTAEEAEAAHLDLMLRFPFAQPDAEWIAAAAANAHRLGCNPGGEVATWEMPVGHPYLARYQFGVLMDRATIERIDAEIAAAEGR